MVDDREFNKLKNRVDDQFAGDHLVGDGARVFNSSDITTANETTTVLTFNSERFDIGSYHSVSSNTERLTIAQSGIYMIGGTLWWENNVTGYRQISIQTSNGTTIATTRVVAGSVSTAYQTIFTLYQLAANDYVRFFARQSSGGNLDVRTISNTSPEFYIWRVG